MARAKEKTPTYIGIDLNAIGAPIKTQGPFAPAYISATIVEIVTTDGIKYTVTGDCTVTHPDDAELIATLEARGYKVNR